MPQKRRKVDTSILTCARKRLECTGNGGSSTAACIHLLPDATTEFAAGSSSGGSLASVAYDAHVLEEATVGWFQEDADFGLV